MDGLTAVEEYRSIILFPIYLMKAKRVFCIYYWVPKVHVIPSRCCGAKSITSDSGG